MRARRNQRWLEPFDPARVDLNYTEANAWQYSFFVPHDVHGLIEAHGGDEPFVSKLDALFDADSRTTGRDQPDITGLIGQYAHGNEPSHHMAWLYHYAGRPGRSAERVRRILDELYAARPDGLAGNEDCGQMSSWYVLAAMGIYPVCPCTDEYPLAAPLFERVTLHLENGRRFRILATGADAERPYVTGARLNGRPLGRSFLRHGEILAGGTLVLDLAVEPSPDWGRSPEERPGVAAGVPLVVPAPFARSAGDTFRDTMTVELDCAEPGAAIFYTRNPELDRGRWTRYERPLSLEETTRLRFVAISGDRESPVVSASFHRIPHDWTVTLSAPPNPQYTAGGPQALVDGLRGDADWRTGGWQGYQYTDFEAIVDLREVRTVRHVTAGFLQDVRSWIWLPVGVTVEVSSDGDTFQEVARIRHDLPGDRRGVFVRDLGATFDPVEARFVRVRARSYGTIPDWHPGRGDGAFIFVDEIAIE